MLHVIEMHRNAAYAMDAKGVLPELMQAARHSWDEALEAGKKHGFKNAQISVLAPTGTIGFLMDCDTTGVEPDIALVKYKWLVGGGLMKIVNQTVPLALEALGYPEAERQDILNHLDREGTIEGAPQLKEEHLPVFDCAFKPAKGVRSIPYMGHIRMMGAVQPFLSGAISKTVNMPAEATPKDVEDAYIESWKLGLKAVAIYRDGSKGQQVLTTSTDKDKDRKAAPAVAAAPAAAAAAAKPQPAVAANPQVQTRIEYRPLRRRLPDERKSLTHKFSVAGHEGYITVGLYDDGTPGEFFIRMAKGGSVIAGLIDAFATSTSIALQYGVPLKVLVNKFAHVRFEPSGFTNNPNIRIAKSIVDYIFRWLALKFLSPEEAKAVGVNTDVQTIGDAGQASFEPPTPVAAPAAEAPSAESCTPACTPMPDEPKAAAPAAAAVQLPLDAQKERGRTSNALTMSFDNQADAPVCDTCGAMMVRNGACYKCLNCGSTSGCS